MVAAAKFETTQLKHLHLARLTRLLLHKNYKKDPGTSEKNVDNKTHKKETVQSRIEAEYQMEKMFMNFAWEFNLGAQPDRTKSDYKFSQANIRQAFRYFSDSS